MKFRPLFFTAGCLALSGVSARADGIDLVAYLTRVGSDSNSFARNALLMAGFMVVNYLANGVVIGLPGLRFGEASGKTVSSHLVMLTLLGQVADRLGAMLAGLLVVLTGITLHFPLSLKGTAYKLLAVNFICSALIVGGLAYYFLRRRWRVPKGKAWMIAVAAGILTNPAWTVFVNRW